MADNRDEGAGQIIVKPHNHDVLCGRGGLTNQHAGNEWFRRLVRSNRALYRSCPKHTKLLVAKAIVQAVQQQEPPGRFLELADKDSGAWCQITYKRAVDKTSQALREKEQPQEKALKGEGFDSEVVQLAAKVAARKGSKKSADLSDLAKATLRQAGLEPGGANAQPDQFFAHGIGDQDRKRKASGGQAPAEFIKPSWWRQGAPNMNQNNNAMNKRMKAEPEEAAPLPPEPLQVRQSSLFRFFSGSGLFGRNDAQQQQQQNQYPGGAQLQGMQAQRASNNFAFSGGGTQLQPNPSDLISAEAAFFEQRPAGTGLPMQRSLGLLDPLPVNGGDNMNNLQQLQQQGGMYSGNMSSSSGNQNRAGNQMPGMSEAGLFPGANNTQAYEPLDANAEGAPPPMNRLTTQVSDWLTSFWPLGKEPQPEQQQQQPQQQQLQQPQPQQQPESQPAPPSDNLERSISSTLFNFAKTPSTFFTSLKTGVTSMFNGDDSVDIQPEPAFAGNAQPASNAIGNDTVIGTASKGDSLLDDYEESAMETRLRTVSSR